MNPVLGPRVNSSSHAGVRKWEQLRRCSQNVSQQTKTGVLHLFLQRETGSYRIEEVRNLHSKSLLPLPPSGGGGGAESSPSSEKRASAGQTRALMSAPMQDRCSGEISHEREASGGGSDGAGWSPGGPRPFSVRTAGSHQRPDQQVDVRRSLMWRFHP